MTERTKIERVGGHLLIGESAIPIASMRAFSCTKADVQCSVWSDNDGPIVAHGWTAREVLEVAYGGGEWLYYPKPTDETRALIDQIDALVEAGTEEIERLRARVAELEHEHDLSTSEGIRARIRDLEAEVDVLTSELEVVEEAEAEEARERWVDANLARVCPGCHAVGEERCAPGCIDAELEEERRRAIESWDYGCEEDDDG